MNRRSTHIATATLAFLFSFACAGTKKQPTPEVPKTIDTATATKNETMIEPPLIAQYQEVANQIIAAARRDKDVWTKLEELAVHIGPRLAGSDGLDKAIRWAEKTMKSDGHENVRIEQVMVPNWKRGRESARLLSPRRQNLQIIGIGGTVATPARGITAEVIVVSSKEDLEQRKSEVRGKIVLYNKIMPAYDREKGDGYGEVYPYRGEGADWAAEHGAKAILVRSLTTSSLGTPHTGGLRYRGRVKLPAAAITTEGANLLATLAARGPVRIELKLASKVGREAKSGNVIAEIVGSEKPEEIVLIGAHIDSWDVGQGAHDDGGGCVIMMQAITLLRKLNLRPKRTIRVVLFTNEENGLRGARQYGTDHADEIANHVLGLESDSGVFAPRGFTVEGDRGFDHTTQIAALLSPLRKMEVKRGFSGADLIPLVRRGVPGIGHWVEGEHYFDIHHTEADTIDKVSPSELVDNLAAVAVFAYVAADMPDRFGGAHRLP